MPELNEDRILVELLREICAEQSVRLTEFSDSWLFCMERGPRVSYVLGYDFGLNNAMARMIAKDKAATSDLLAYHGVPRVEHTLFHSPQIADYVTHAGNWPRMMQYFEQHGHDVVCKPNEGTGGLGVTRARSLVELEKAVLLLFRQHRALCLSPFENFTAEYRVALLRGRCEFIYRKERPALLGDGRSTIRELLGAWVSQQPDLGTIARLAADLAAIPRETLDLQPAAGAAVELNWRHNLGQGAAPTLLDSGEARAREIVALARRATQALGVELASVDVAEVGGTFQVLEVNSGIMMESFARMSPENRAIAKGFYTKIVCAVMEEPPAA